jgi:hypothetical protein
MRIPFLDVKSGYLELKQELDEAYHRVINSGEYIQGSELEAFEKEFSKYGDFLFIKHFFQTHLQMYTHKDKLLYLCIYLSDLMKYEIQNFDIIHRVLDINLLETGH